MRSAGPAPRGAVTPARAALATLGLLTTSACFGTPTPLAPGLAGSVGWPHHGVQTDAVELPGSGVGFTRYRSQGGHYWGQPELVLGISAAAERVHTTFPGGQPLVVGDLSARYGGKIARHHTHRSGRDVDLLWYLITPDGEPVQSSSFVRIDGPRPAWLPRRGAVTLDAAREWALLEALLSSPYLEVQWLYVSSSVEAHLLEHARAIGAKPELIQRAADALLEPADSLPHDDHLHLRIACSPERSVAGCEGGGPSWRWQGAPAELPPVSNEQELLGEAQS
jgi:penicillin-insensitive murein DD-endopeptidase